MEKIRDEIDFFRDRLSDMSKASLEVIREAQGHLPIPSFHLNSACEEQSESYFAVAQAYSKAYTLFQQLKQSVKECTAGMAIDIRQSPDKYGMVKVTEGAVIDLINSDAQMGALTKQMFQAEAIFTDLRGLMDAFEHRRSMLNNLTELYSSGLYESGQADSKVDTYKERLPRKAVARGGKKEE